MTPDDPETLARPQTGDARALAALVHRFLRASEARDLPELEAMSMPGFTATFPGGVVHASVAAWMESSSRSFESVRKQFERFDVVAGDAPGSGTVYAFGLLTGRFRDGPSLDGTRFIDRFEVADGRILRQSVWNDLAARGLSGPAPVARGAAPQG
jgi:ketosteroid isomerase-like protein